MFLTLQNIKLSHFLLKCLAFATKPSLHSVHWYCYSSWLKSSWYQMIGRLVAWDPHPLVPRYKEVELGTRLHQKSKSNLYMRGILFGILLTLEMRDDMYSTGKLVWPQYDFDMSFLDFVFPSSAPQYHRQFDETKKTFKIKQKSRTQSFKSSFPHHHINYL